MPSSSMENCAGVSAAAVPPSRPRPKQPALLKPLGEQTVALTVPPQDLDEPPLTTTKNEGCPENGSRLRWSCTSLAKSHRTPSACRCVGRQPDTWRRQAPGSSTDQGLDHAPQYGGIDIALSPKTMAARQFDLDYADGRRRLGWIDRTRQCERDTRICPQHWSWRACLAATETAG